MNLRKRLGMIPTDNAKIIYKKAKKYGQEYQNMVNNK